MGQPAPGAPDEATRAIAGTLSAVGAGAASRFRGRTNVSLWGTFVATVVIERSFDGGTTWLPLSVDAGGTPVSLTAPCSLMVDEPEAGVLYRVRCASYTSGTISWRISH